MWYQKEKHHLLGQCSTRICFRYYHPSTAESHLGWNTMCWHMTCVGQVLEATIACQQHTITNGDTRQQHPLQCAHNTTTELPHLMLTWACDKTRGSAIEEITTCIWVRVHIQTRDQAQVHDWIWPTFGSGLGLRPVPQHWLYVDCDLDLDQISKIRWSIRMPFNIHIHLWQPLISCCIDYAKRFSHLMGVHSCYRCTCIRLAPCICSDFRATDCITWIG